MASTTATWYRASATSPWTGQVGYDGGALVGRFQFTTPSTGAATFSWRSSTLAPRESTTWAQSTQAANFRWEITTSNSADIGKVSSSAGYAVGTSIGDSNYMDSNGAKTVQLLPNTTYYLWIFPTGTAYNHWLISSVTVTFGGVYGTPSTVACTNPATFGQGNMITLSRNQTSALHTVKVTCLGRTETLLTKGSTYPTLTWTPSVATYAPLLTNAKSTTATITVETFYSGYSVGTRSVSVIINFRDADVKPNVTMAVSDPTGYLTTYGAYVATKSKIQVALTATYQYGASYFNTAITANGQNFATNPAMTSEIASASNTAVTGKIVDSRNVSSNTASATLTILAYSAPQINSFSIHRCDQDGTANDGGDYVRVDYDVEITALNDHNSKALAVKYKKRSDANYSTESVTLSTYAQSGYVVIAADTNYTYDVQLALTDDFTTVTEELQLSTAFATVNYRAGGSGIAFGKVAETDDCFEVAPRWKVRFAGAEEISVGSTSSDLIRYTSAISTLNRAYARRTGGTIIFSFVATLNSAVSTTTALFEIDSSIMPDAYVDFVVMHMTNDAARTTTSLPGLLRTEDDDVVVIKDIAAGTIRGEIVWAL